MNPSSAYNAREAATPPVPCPSWERPSTWSWRAEMLEACLGLGSTWPSRHWALSESSVTKPGRLELWTWGSVHPATSFLGDIPLTFSRDSHSAIFFAKFQVLRRKRVDERVKPMLLPLLDTYCSDIDMGLFKSSCGIFGAVNIYKSQPLWIHQVISCPEGAPRVEVC